MNFFDMDAVFFSLFGQAVSYLEFFGVLAGAIAVTLSAKAHVWSWPIGLVNVTLFFFLFFQVQLYPDMFLQVFFFVTNLIGWWRWTHPLKGEEDQKDQLRVSYLSSRLLIIFLTTGVAATVLFGALASRLHEFIPYVFSKPSSFPYADSFITVMSIWATYLMVNKKIECWVIWIVVDAIAAVLYFTRDIRLVGIEYGVYCIIAAWGLINWKQEYMCYRHDA